VRYNRNPKTPERAAYALRRRRQGATLKEVAGELGLSQERVRQLSKLAERVNKNSSSS
jgi:DNA-directed RNA polymerase sigma subunit (sigma70/sigma32)